MATTPNLGLTQLEVGQASKEATINANNSILDDVIAAVSAVRAYNSANQSIANITNTALIFNQERRDDGLLHDVSVDNTRFTAIATAWHIIVTTVKFATNATGFRQVSFRLNGTTFIGGDQSTNAISGNETMVTAATGYYLTAGDYLEVMVYQSSGAALNVLTTGNNSPEVLFAQLGVGGGGGGAGSGDALTTNPLSQFAATTSAELAGVITNETGTGLLVFATSPTITTPTISGAITFPDGVRQTFNPNGTVAGLNVGSQAGDPSTPINGDIWYDSTANTLDARINGATINLGAGGGGGGGDALVANPLSQFAATTSAQLAGVLADETGSGGGFVRATSPTLVTPVLGAATGTSLSTTGSITSGSGGGVSGDVALSGSSSGIAHVTVPAAAGTGTFQLPVTTGGTFSLGYKNIPQNSQSAAYTLVLEDDAKHLYHPSADTTARIWTIPANSSVAFPIGTAITFVNDSSAGVVTISITTDTLVFAGTGTTGSRTLAANGIATAIKMTSTRWMISGTGLT